MGQGRWAHTTPVTQELCCREALHRPGTCKLIPSLPISSPCLNCLLVGDWSPFKAQGQGTREALVLLVGLPLLFVGGIPNATLTHTASQEVAAYLCSRFCLLEDQTPQAPHHSLYDTHRHVPWQRYCPKVFLTEPLSCSAQMHQSIHSSQDLFGQQMSAQQLSGFPTTGGLVTGPLLTDLSWQGLLLSFTAWAGRWGDGLSGAL